MIFIFSSLLFQISLCLVSIIKNIEKKKKNKTKEKMINQISLKSPEIHFNLLYSIYTLPKLDGMQVNHRDTLEECCKNLFTGIHFEIFSLLSKFFLYYIS